MESACMSLSANRSPRSRYVSPFGSSAMDSRNFAMACGYAFRSQKFLASSASASARSFGDSVSCAAARGGSDSPRKRRAARRRSSGLAAGSCGNPYVLSVFHKGTCGRLRPLAEVFPVQEKAQVFPQDLPQSDGPSLPLLEEGPERLRHLHPDEPPGLVPDVPEPLLEAPGHVDILRGHRGVEPPHVAPRFFPARADH